MTVIEGNFYEVTLAETFDVVCYWDGFGVGMDHDQRRLLKRIAAWLKPGGCALVDVYTPWYWANVASGREWRVGSAFRRYGLYAAECRLLDTWWPVDHPKEAVTQSLRCYSPADLRLLLAGTGVMLAGWEPGGAMDYEEMAFHTQVPLEEAMSYVAHLVPEPVGL